MSTLDHVPHRVGEVLVVEARGVLTGSSLYSLNEVIDRELKRKDARAVMVDLRGTRLRLRLKSWRWGPHGAWDWPRAFVVNECDLKRADDACNLHNADGISCVAFLEVEGEHGAMNWSANCRARWHGVPARYDAKRDVAFQVFMRKSAGAFEGEIRG